MVSQIYRDSAGRVQPDIVMHPKSRHRIDLIRACRAAVPPLSPPPFVPHPPKRCGALSSDMASVQTWNVYHRTSFRGRLLQRAMSRAACRAPAIPTMYAAAPSAAFLVRCAAHNRIAKAAASIA
jgi:hypothetical protein